MKYKDIPIVDKILSDISGRDIVAFVKNAGIGTANSTLNPFIAKESRI